MELVGENLPQFVRSQIGFRQLLHGSLNKTTEQLAYLNSKNAWVKLGSGITLLDTSDRLKQIRVN